MSAVRLDFPVGPGRARGGSRPWRRAAEDTRREREAAQRALGEGGVDLERVARAVELQDSLDVSTATASAGSEHEALQAATTRLLQAATNGAHEEEVASALAAAEEAAAAAGLPPRCAAARARARARCADKLALLHEVMPRLWVGGWAALNNDCQPLRQRGITHVVSVVSGDQRRLPAFVRGHYYARCDDRAESAANLSAHFAPAADFIGRSRAEGGVVFVHCGAGISRAPTVAAAYVMLELGLTAADAMKLVRARRTCARPNVGFAEALREWEGACKKEPGAELTPRQGTCTPTSL